MNQASALSAFNSLVPARIVPIAINIVRREGGWVDHPNDPGGATKHGVSLRYARTQGTLFDLDGDGDVDKNDIRLITPDMAAAVFILEFYLEPKINTLPEVIQAQVFDMAVNAGAKRAMILLQRMVNNLRMNDVDRLMEDGVLGPKTYQALGTAASRFGTGLVKKYAEERLAFYRGLARSKPSLAVFLRGWENRVHDSMKD